LKNKLTGYLRLTRPANLVTSVADVLAGAAIAGFLSVENTHSLQPWPVLLLCISTIGLYGGGVVFNDFFDARLDAVERPERPIPSGLISRREAGLLGSLLLIAGIAAAAAVHAQSALLALLIAASALVYDKWGKHHPFLGPLNMGLCRGLNLLLGVSIVLPAIAHTWYLALIPIIYIASITMISRGEVHGGSSRLLWVASGLYLLVIGGIGYFAWKKGTLLFAFIFLAPFAWMIFRPLFRAIQAPVV
jgi:4-hydroxybenzoate polyprenyltransferase